MNSKVGVMGREEYGEQHVGHVGGSFMAWVCMYANRTGSLVSIDDVTANRSSRMNSKVYRVIIFAQTYLNAAKLTGQCFTASARIQQKMVL